MLAVPDYSGRIYLFLCALLKVAMVNLIAFLKIRWYQVT